MRGGRALALGLALALPAACTTSEAPYQHNRFDYWAFRAREGMLPEPNYLPWILHRETLRPGERVLVACRWPDDAFPLQYWVEPPQIATELQDEFNPRGPSEYVAAVRQAFSTWEEAIGRPVRFRPVTEAAQADLVVRLRATSYVAEDARVLGRVRNVEERCRVLGPGPTAERAAIEFSVPEAEIYVVDRHGLLTPRQVRAVTLHELGHVLGAGRQHSPLRGDVMYEVADDSRVEELSEHDRNTFRALYRVDPGAIYTRLGQAHTEPLPEVRRGPPRLGQVERDARARFGVRFPVGWQVIRSRRGWVAVDGVTWDYDASMQVLSLRGELDAFAEQQRRSLVLRGELEAAERVEIDGQPVARLVARGDGFTEVTTAQQWDPGWLLITVADCATRDYDLYRPWFERVLLSLERPEE